MTSEPEDPSEPEGPEPAIEDSLDAWGEATAEPMWVPIDAELPPPAADPIPEAAYAPQNEPTAGSEPRAESESKSDWEKSPSSAPTPPPSAPAAPGGHLRRPSSLRAALDDRAPNVPRRPLTPPPFEVETPQANPAPARDAERPAPADLARDLAGSLPKRMVALTNERPEVGLGVAFLGGLVLAAILKRLGRK